MPEILLHYIWERCLWAGFEQATTEGEPLSILSVGEHNFDAGPDYSHARIRIGVQEWSGNIEIHVCSSDWYRHKHHLDPAYDHVILHVVRKADKIVYNSQGEVIPQCELHYPDRQDYISQLLSAAQQMDSAKNRIGCAEQLLREPRLLSDGWRHTLLLKRLECKRLSINRLLDITKGSWEHALYISLARNFGFHTNSVPFEQVAIQTPLSCLQKHRNNLYQLTAILMGQAGLLETTDPMYKEYVFLQTKFSLSPIEPAMWKHSRLRPQNSPELRIRQFAQLLHQSEFLLSRILDARTLEELEGLMELHPTPTSNVPAVPVLGRASIDILLINTLLPYKYAYAHTHNNSHLAAAVMEMIEQIPAEDNSIVRQWRLLGQEVRNAADSQALLHLYQNYCQHHECINCEVGYQIFIDKQLKLF